MTQKWCAMTGKDKVKLKYLSQVCHCPFLSVSLKGPHNGPKLVSWCITPPTPAPYGSSVTWAPSLHSAFWISHLLFPPPGHVSTCACVPWLRVFCHSRQLWAPGPRPSGPYPASFSLQHDSLKRACLLFRLPSPLSTGMQVPHPRARLPCIWVCYQETHDVCPHSHNFSRTLHLIWYS